MTALERKGKVAPCGFGLGLALLLLLASALSLRLNLPLGLSRETQDALLHLRWARLLAAFAAGSALAVAGVLIQGLLRNPLASPSVIGTTAGASLGGQIALLLLFHLGSSAAIAAEMVLPLGCLAGALFALFFFWLFMFFSRDRFALLLVGFLLSALFSSVGGVLIAFGQQWHALGRAMVGFSLGGLQGVGFPLLRVVAPLLVAALLASQRLAAPLDLLLSGEEEAESLGVDVRATQRWTVLWVAMLCAAAVALAGNLLFVGLVVPHLLRPWLGVRHRDLLPCAALAGGVFLILCDLLVRLIPLQAELPLGVLTGLLGAPLFLVLLLRQRREWSVA